jgi:catechol 2,3-dioxygenase-like lactoylglutathione lyase family enzyme
MLAEKEMLAAADARPLATALHGVHHTARPTWKLAETVHFYRDILELKICHAICARGWGPEDHPDFIHFFFESGNGSTIAFFYYLGCEKPVDTVEEGSFLWNSVHTAWSVESREELAAWKSKLESKGLDVLHVQHEIIESIYVIDPNGYGIEIAYQTRPMNAQDAIDAELTLKAAIEAEAATNARVETVDVIWQRKADLVHALITE